MEYSISNDSNVIKEALLNIYDRVMVLKMFVDVEDDNLIDIFE